MRISVENSQFKLLLDTLNFDLREQSFRSCLVRMYHHVYSSLTLYLICSDFHTSYLTLYYSSKFTFLQLGSNVVFLLQRWHILQVSPQNLLVNLILQNLYLPTGSLWNLFHKDNPTSQLLVMDHLSSQPFLDLFLHLHTRFMPRSEYHICSW